MKAVTAIQRNSNHKIHSIRQILIPVILVLLFGMILYKCNQFTKEPLTSTAGQTYERATVTAVTRDNLAEDGNRYGNQQVPVCINSGTYKGKSFSATSPSGQLFGATCKPGMHVIVILSASSGTQVATVYSQNRIPAILAFIGIFTAAVCLIGGRKGIMSIFGLVFAFTAILYLMFPAIYQGASPILMAVLVSVLTTVVTLGLLNGFSRKTWSAMLGTSFGVAVTGIAAALFGAAAGISGYNVTEIETLSYVGQHSNLQIGQLLFAGIIISALGAVMDVGMSLASAIQEIHEANPSMGRRQLFASGMRVGRDMMGTMTNTLILAFVGGSLTTLVIDYAYNISFYQLINSYQIGIEIMQGVAGSLGIVLTVPITSFIASWLTKRS